MQGQLPKYRNSRAIPFSLRREVRDKIQEMIRHGVLERSYLNPLTLVERKDKTIRICLDARQVNKFTISDKTKAMPIQKLLQTFHAANYISLIDLNSAFLQTPLKEVTKVDCVQFEGQVYQFTRLPYGYKNTLASFIRALQQVLGQDCIEYVIHYVDDILIY
jgi:hypothetical protein